MPAPNAVRAPRGDRPETARLTRALANCMRQSAALIRNGNREHAQSGGAMIDCSCTRRTRGYRRWWGGELARELETAGVARGRGVRTSGRGG
jgi:hypothetical protein